MSSSANEIAASKRLADAANDTRTIAERFATLAERATNLAERCGARAALEESHAAESKADAERLERRLKRVSWERDVYRHVIEQHYRDAVLAPVDQLARRFGIAKPEGIA